jgi:hypothetical protein
VPLQRILDLAARQTLPAPIDTEDGETASLKLADYLEVFFDELGTPRRNYDCAARLASR